MLSRLQASQSSWAQHRSRVPRPAHRLNVVLAASAKVSMNICKHVEFGEQVAVVGSVPELGAWGIESAVLLTWSEPDTWHLDIDLPAGQSIEYKYIVQKGSAQEVEWQAGENLTISLPEATTAATVTDTWDGGHGSVETTPAQGAVAAVEIEAAAAVEAPEAVEEEPAAVEEEPAAVEAVQETVATAADTPASNILPGSPTKSIGKAVAAGEELEVAV